MRFPSLLWSDSIVETIRLMGLTMATLKIRKDRTPAVLRKLAKEEPDARISRRLLAIANALDGMSRAEAARCAGMAGI